MVRIKDFEKISIQKKNNIYYYLRWGREGKMMSWPGKLHKYEKDQVNIGPTILVEWEE